MDELIEMLNPHIDMHGTEKRAKGISFQPEHDLHEAKPRSRDQCVPHLIAHQAARTPSALALAMGEQRMSYAELNARANQLAHALLSRGVGPDVLVGICVERSLEMIVGLLGILKAGAAYLPLDPTYPSERLTFILEDAQVPVLLTHERLRANLPAMTAEMLCLDADAALWQEQHADEQLTGEANLDNLVYVIYTSGSTGQPKGVQITHCNLLNLISWHQEAFALTSADRATQVASPAFDATGWEIWPYLTCGASLYLPDEETKVTPTVLRDWLLQQGITISFLPTALAERLMELEWPQEAPLRFLLTGADVLQRYPSPTLPFTLVNNYGPTEATVVATSGPVLPQEQPERPPSIGRPIANTSIYLLDEQMQQVPIGEVGEVYIGGAGIAKGYLRRPELTAERFVQNPFVSTPGERLYKTGDMARYLPNGELAFLGRSDYQIKIRGYRIEPNEIVAVLNRHPQVKKSVVIARDESGGERRLVAYLECAIDAPITASKLQELLREYLPDYMVPSVFVRMEALPVTANGKINRDVLPTPDAENTLRDEAVDEPLSPVEEQVREIIAVLLNLQQVGLDENFFMLGGHSLLGTQVIARVAERFGVDLSLRVLFNAPTVRLLSQEIERRILEKLDAMSDEEAEKLLRLL